MYGVFSQTPDSVDDRSQFSLTFGLNIDSNTSQVLVDNNIQRFDPNSYPSKVVRQYFDNTKPPNYQLVDIWSVYNTEHYKKFIQKGHDQADNLLLWHGTKRHNLVSILETGLKPMFRAVYFADHLSTSAGYTDRSGPEVLLLCQVALDKSWEVRDRYVWPTGSESMRILENKMLGNCLVPCGTNKDRKYPAAIYSVVDQDRIRIKFVLHCSRMVTPC